MDFQAQTPNSLNSTVSYFESLKNLKDIKVRRHKVNESLSPKQKNARFTIDGWWGAQFRIQRTKKTTRGVSFRYERGVHPDTRFSLKVALIPCIRAPASTTAPAPNPCETTLPRSTRLLSVVSTTTHAPILEENVHLSAVTWSGVGEVCRRSTTERL